MLSDSREINEKQEIDSLIWESPVAVDRESSGLQDSFLGNRIRSEIVLTQDMGCAPTKTVQKFIPTPQKRTQQQGSLPVEPPSGLTNANSAVTASDPAVPPFDYAGGLFMPSPNRHGESLTAPLPDPPRGVRRSHLELRPGRSNPINENSSTSPSSSRTLTSSPRIPLSSDGIHTRQFYSPRLPSYTTPVSTVGFAAPISGVATTRKGTKRGELRHTKSVADAVEESRHFSPSLRAFASNHAAASDSIVGLSSNGEPQIGTSHNDSTSPDNETQHSVRDSNNSDSSPRSSTEVPIDVRSALYGTAAVFDNGTQVVLPITLGNDANSSGNESQAGLVENVSSTGTPILRSAHQPGSSVGFVDDSTGGPNGSWTAGTTSSRFIAANSGAFTERHAAARRHRSMLDQPSQRLKTSLSQQTLPQHQHQPGQRLDSQALREAFVSSHVSRLSPLKSGRTLARQLHLRGSRCGVLLSQRDVDNMHLTEADSFFFNFKQQSLHSSNIPVTWYYGSGAARTIFILGLFVLISGILCLALSSGYHEKIIPYSLSSPKAIEFRLEDAEAWSRSKEVFVYLEVQNFENSFRTYQSSKPPELFKGSSCRDLVNVSGALQVRSRSSLPEIETLNEDVPLFPCGLMAFSIMNDEISIARFDESSPTSPQPLPMNYDGIAPSEQLVVFASIKRPENRPLSKDWVSPVSPRYRNWVNANPGPTVRIPIGRYPDGLGVGRYQLNLVKNVWPSEAWSAPKAVVLAQLSLLGSSQVFLGLFYIVWGGGMMVLAVVFHIAHHCGAFFVRESVNQVKAQEVAEGFDRIRSMCEQQQQQQPPYISRLSSVTPVSSMRRGIT